MKNVKVRKVEIRKTRVTEISVSGLAYQNHPP